MDDAATTLLLLPGLVCDERVWQPVVARLGSVAGARVVPLRSGDSMSALAAAVLAGAPQRFAVAGLSMGGYCALEIVRQAADRVIALALVDTSARPDTAEGRANREKQIERARTDYAGVVTELAGKWVHPSRIDDPAVGGVTRDMALASGPDTFERQQRAIMSRADSRPLLGTIGCPTVVVAGRDDAIMGEEIHRELADGIAGAELVMIDRCGHLSPLEQPDAVAGALSRCLSRIR